MLQKLGMNKKMTIGMYDPASGIEDLLGPLFILWIVLVVVGLIVNIALMVYVYKDAEARGMGGAIWLIIVFFTGCLGCIIFLIVRGNHPK